MNSLLTKRLNVNFERKKTKKKKRERERAISKTFPLSINHIKKETPWQKKIYISIWCWGTTTTTNSNQIISHHGIKTCALFKFTLHTHTQSTDTILWTVLFPCVCNTSTGVSLTQITSNSFFPSFFFRVIITYLITLVCFGKGRTADSFDIVFLFLASLHLSIII